MIPLRDVPLHAAFRTTITERIGVKLSKGGVRGIRVDLGPSEVPEFAYPSQEKHVCSRVLVKRLRVSLP